MHTNASRLAGSAVVLLATYYSPSGCSSVDATPPQALLNDAGPDQGDAAANPDANQDGQLPDRVTCDAPSPVGCLHSDAGCPGTAVCTMSGCAPSTCLCFDGFWKCSTDCAGGTCVDGDASTSVDCASNSDCDPAGWCDIEPAPAGRCSLGEAKWGTCRLRPDPSTCDPTDTGCQSLCGCDGTTYCSACSAHAAGVSIAATNDGCSPDSGPVGTPCGVPGSGAGECAADEWCDFPDDCGTSQAEGVCKTRPPSGSCSTECPYLCGCDGVVYCNACEASLAGTDVSTDYECIELTFCGGPNDPPCAKGKYCSFGDYACGEYSAGICLAEETPLEYCDTYCDEVCGCDGQLYCNGCVAHANGVDVSTAFPPDCSLGARAQ